MSSSASTTWYFLFFSLLTGFAVSSALTLVMVIWSWRENPNGIFHDPLATNWQFVFDTALSWFVPTLFYISCTLVILQILSISKRLLSQRINRQKT